MIDTQKSTVKLHLKPFPAFATSIDQVTAPTRSGKFLATLLALLGCGLGIFCALPTYLEIRVRTATPKQIEDTKSPHGNYRLTDALADLSSAIQDRETTEVYIPIRSISRPQDPVCLILVERKYFLSELRSHPNLIKLEGSVSDWDEGGRKVPQLPVRFSDHIVRISMGLPQSIGERDITNLGLGIGVMALSILLWIRFFKTSNQRGKTEPNT